jgi:serpin B
MRRITTVALALAAAACTDPVGPEPPLTELPRTLTPAEARLIDAGQDFTFSLLRAVLEADAGAVNHFISPLSASVALGMTLNGAAGATADSMRAALGFGALTMAEINAGYRGLIDLLGDLDAAVVWSLANSVWYRRDYVFRQTFLDAARVFFDADTRALDFAAPDAGPTINRWVRDRTQNRITSIVPDVLPANAIMYLINAIYFKGAWTTAFDPARTQPRPFSLAGGGTVTVSMMAAQDLPVRTAGTTTATVVELPYARGAFAMTLVLPAPGEDVDALARDLTREQWNRWIASLEPGAIAVAMPKFTIAYRIELPPVLRALGMGIAFCDSGRFDFTAMDPSGEACIFDARQKTFVQVDENGTEAAAVTSIGMGVTSAPPSIVVDRPFLFAIRERLSGTILFIGVVRNPVAG